MRTKITAMSVRRRRLCSSLSSHQCDKAFIKRPCVAQTGDGRRRVAMFNVTWKIPLCPRSSHSGRPGQVRRSSSSATKASRLHLGAVKHLLNLGFQSRLSSTYGYSAACLRSRRSFYSTLGQNNEPAENRPHRELRGVVAG